MPRAEPTVDMTPAIELRATRRAFGSVVALESVSLTIAPGEFFALLGPSGSGKTTCLRLIAGFDQPDSGTILLDGDDVTNTPPFARNVNTVFQDYALFPHMTVADNVAYGLRVRGIAAAERAKQAAAMLDLVRLGEFGARRPHQLSGGQRQRVALARALINRPKVLLLDEPLGALDLKLREEMQAELKGLQQRLGITFVFVTHDQGEALSMADRVAVFSQGRIEQLDTPRELYNRPQTAFVASFVGSANVVSREAARLLTGSDRAFAIRPELIDVLASGEPVREGSVHCAGEVIDVLYHGASSRLRVKVDAHTTLAVARAETAGGGVAGLATGARVLLAWRPDHAVPLRD
jgi:putative spermidine/putrescine transport system ATP-binding protein